jgi:DNA repair exonuclease SbcCD ATPase subunit
MAESLTLSILDICLLTLVAIILGATIHFFITSRRNLKANSEEMRKSNLVKNEWKLKYLNDIELRDKEIAALKQQIQEAEENANIFSIEAEELRLQNDKFEEVIAKLEKKIEELEQTPTPPLPPVVSIETPIQSKVDFLDQVITAQSRLMDQNQKINSLLTDLEVIREKEEKLREAVRDNAELSAQLNRLRVEMSEKEKEVDSLKQKEQLTKEMTSMLDVAYTEFNTLQAKIQKLEAQLTSSKMINLEYEGLKEEHSKFIKELEEYKAKAASLASENLQLQTQLTEALDKLREANFQRQQLQKRIVYLEELNADLQIVADANKKLEGQLKRIGELESMLNIVNEEKGDPNRRQDD